jgi:hypothetical protein
VVFYRSLCFAGLVPDGLRCGRVLCGAGRVGWDGGRGEVSLLAGRAEVLKGK